MPHVDASLRGRSQISLSSHDCTCASERLRPPHSPLCVLVQSRSENPAVLVITASAQGTSAQVVAGRANHLRFNKAGLAADFVAERLSDDRAARGVAAETEGEAKAKAMSAEEAQRNRLLIIQVRQTRRRTRSHGAGCTRLATVMTPAAAVTRSPWRSIS